MSHARHLLVLLAAALLLLGSLPAASAAVLDPTTVRTGAMAPSSCPPDVPCPSPDCLSTGCAGRNPSGTNCDDNASNTYHQWVAVLGAYLEIRNSGLCNSNWARVYWQSDSCAMSGIAVQRRVRSGTTWDEGPVQQVTKGPSAFCSGNKYWTNMVGGSPGQVRVRYAEGYYSGGTVKFAWHDWSGWYAG